jgi:hypothetical protein
MMIIIVILLYFIIIIITENLFTQHLLDSSKARIKFAKIKQALVYLHNELLLLFLSASQSSLTKF